MAVQNIWAAPDFVNFAYNALYLGGAISNAIALGLLIPSFEKRIWIPTSGGPAEAGSEVKLSDTIMKQYNIST